MGIGEMGICEMVGHRLKVHVVASYSMVIIYRSVGLVVLFICSFGSFVRVILLQVHSQLCCIALPAVDVYFIIFPHYTSMPLVLTFCDVNMVAYNLHVTFHTKIVTID